MNVSVDYTLNISVFLMFTSGFRLYVLPIIKIMIFHVVFRLTVISNLYYVVRKHAQCVHSALCSCCIVKNLLQEPLYSIRVGLWGHFSLLISMKRFYVITDMRS